LGIKLETLCQELLEHFEVPGIVETLCQELLDKIQLTISSLKKQVLA